MDQVVGINRLDPHICCAFAAFPLLAVMVPAFESSSHETFASSHDSAVSAMVRLIHYLAGLDRYEEPGSLRQDTISYSKHGSSYTGLARSVVLLKRMTA